MKRVEAARLLGVDPSQITRWVIRGLPLTTEKAVREWHRVNVRPAEPAREATEAMPTSWRERKDRAAALAEEMRLAERRGELVERDAVKATWADMVSAFRARVLALPSKIAPQVAVPGKVRQTEAILTAAVHEALAELAGDGLPSR